MRPLHKKRKRRANAASLIVLINERTTRPHVFAVPQVRRRVYELFGAQGSGARGAAAEPALTSFQFAVACTLVALLTASALPAPKNLPRFALSPSFSLAFCLPSLFSPLLRPLQLPSRLVVELFIRFCRVLHFLNLQFFWSAATAHSALFLDDPPRPWPGHSLHAAVPFAFVYSAYLLYLFFN